MLAFSLDLSDNRLTNHLGLVSNLKEMKRLNGLNLSQNPMSYFTSFNFFSVAALDLDFFNDEAVSSKPFSAVTVECNFTV